MNELESALVGTVCLLACACAPALAQQRIELEAELGQLQTAIDGAVERGGRSTDCAPKALAYAEANATFAEQTLAADQLERAREHLDEARRWIGQAWQTIESKSCAP